MSQRESAQKHQLERSPDELEPIGGVKRKKRNVESMRKHEPFKLNDLSTEVLLKIFDYVHVWHHSTIRATSRRMHDVYDVYVKHTFNSTLQQRLKNDPDSYPSAVLLAIKAATDAYVHSGYESVFCGCMLSLMRSSYYNPLCPQPQDISIFLTNFYALTKEKHKLSSQRSRLLFNITFMRLLKKFKMCSVTTLESSAMDWAVAVELYGPWIGVMKGSKRFHIPLDQQYVMLLILTEILVSNICERAYKRIADYHNSIYIFGNDTRATEKSTLTFVFTVHSSRKLCTFFHTCLEMDDMQFTWPEQWPKDKFTMLTDIHCSQAATYGAAGLLFLESNSHLTHWNRPVLKTLEKAKSYKRKQLGKK